MTENNRSENSNNGGYLCVTVEDCVNHAKYRKISEKDFVNCGEFRLDIKQKLTLLDLATLKMRGGCDISG